MKAYSNDLRKRIIAARNNGDKVNDIAERFSVSVRFIYSLLRLFRMTGSYEAKKNSGGAPRKISSEDEEKIRQFIEEKPDLTLEEIKEQGNLEVSVSTIHRAIKRMKITLKKNALSSRTKLTESTRVKEALDGSSSMLEYKQSCIHRRKQYKY